ncbi:unnamed protein product [Urochloa humidicola]
MDGRRGEGAASGRRLEDVAGGPLGVEDDGAATGDGACGGGGEQGAVRRAGGNRQEVGHTRPRAAPSRLAAGTQPSQATVIRSRRRPPRQHLRREDLES